MDDTFAFYVTVLRKDFADFSGGRLQEMGLSRGLLYFLLYIGKHPDCGPGAVSAALGADTGHTARSIEKLVQAGIVERRKHETDGRASCLRLTENGENAFKEAYTVFRKWDEEALAVLNQEERETGRRILRTLLAGRMERRGVKNDV